MAEIPVDWVALAIAVALKQAIGALWYAPIAFGRVERAHAGVDRAAARARLSLALPLETGAACVLAYVLLHAIRHAGGYGALSGGGVGFASWLGFVATSALNGVLYGRRPFALYAIDMGYWLVALVVMGAVLGVGR